MSSTNIPLYIPSVPAIPSSFSHLLSTYSNIPTSEQKAHIQVIRDGAYEHHKYPCLGRFRFLDLDMSAHIMYQHVVSLFRESHQDKAGPLSGPTRTGEGTEIARVFLDLGCCIGQDLRKLLLDCSTSLPPSISLTSRLYGADLLPEFINAGYVLFNDRVIMPRSQFIAPADVFDTSERNALGKLDGKVNVLHVGAFFHLFDWERQKMVARRCLRLLRRAGVDSRVSGEERKPKEGLGGDGDQWKKRALIFGEQVGNITAGEVARANGGGSRYRHNGESWRTMWEEVVKEEEWKDVVKEVAVESRLEERSQASKARDSADDKEALGKAAELEAGSQGEQKKFIGKIEEGFRWQIWWVWVAFV